MAIAIAIVGAIDDVIILSFAFAVAIEGVLIYGTWRNFKGKQA